MAGHSSRPDWQERSCEKNEFFFFSVSLSDAVTPKGEIIRGGRCPFGACAKTKRRQQRPETWGFRTSHLHAHARFRDRARDWPRPDQARYLRRAQHTGA